MDRSRRRALQLGAGSAVALALPLPLLFSSSLARAANQPPKVALVMKSLGAAVRTSKARPPAARMAAFTRAETPSRWLKQEESSDEVLITAILGFSRSASVRPSDFHWARRTAQRGVPGVKLLRLSLIHI